MDTLQLIKDKTAELLPQLNNPSVTAEYKLWQQIFAKCTTDFLEKVETDQAEINDIVERNRGICTANYFVRVAKEFQWNDKIAYRLEVQPNGEVKYTYENPEHRIILQASAVVDEHGVKALKVATKQGDTLAPITAAQMIDFKNYIYDLSIPGIPVSVVSVDADKLAVEASVYYDVKMNSNLLLEAIKQNLTAYSQSQQFDGYIYKNQVIDFLQKIEGVIDVSVTSLTLRNASGETISIDRKGETLAGYFNIDFENTKINLLPNE